MSQDKPFLAPRFDGPRFEDHSIPLEVLKDFAVLEEMIVETAKWCYLQRHPERKRTPRGFTDKVTLKLSGIDEGSAIPLVHLAVAASLLFSPKQQYFEEARDKLAGAINAAEYNEPITKHLPESLLPYFDRIGRSLREGESIEFAPDAPTRKARLTKPLSRKLALAASQLQEVTDEVTLRGAIPEVDQADMSFKIHPINGQCVKAPMNTLIQPVVLDAIKRYTQGQRVLLQGIGRFSRSGKLQSIESVEHLTLLESRDIAVRLEELKALQHGWLDGKGRAPDPAGLDWLVNAFQQNYSGEQLPLLYPTAEGGIQAEWSAEGWETSLEIDLETHQAEWHALDIHKGLDDNRLLNLDTPDDWQWLADQITAQAGGAA